MAFGFSVPLLGSSSLSVPTYACRKGAGFCQAGKRQSRGRAGGATTGYAWPAVRGEAIGDGDGMGSGGARIGRRAAGPGGGVCVRG